MTCSAKVGCSCTRYVKWDSSTGTTRASVRAVALAPRGAGSISAISPKIPPAVITSMTRPARVRSISPSTTAYITSPASPSVNRTCPASIVAASREFLNTLISGMPNSLSPRRDPLGGQHQEFTSKKPPLRGTARRASVFPTWAPRTRVGRSGPSKRERREPFVHHGRDEGRGLVGQHVGDPHEPGRRRAEREQLCGRVVVRAVLAFGT